MNLWSLVFSGIVIQALLMPSPCRAVNTRSVADLQAGLVSICASQLTSPQKAEDFLSALPALYAKVFIQGIERILSRKTPVSFLKPEEMKEMIGQTKALDFFAAELRREVRAKYLGLVVLFHDTIFLPAKAEGGFIHVSPDLATPTEILRLIEKGIVRKSMNVLEYVYRTSAVRGLKIYKRDIIDPSAFAQHFGLKRTAFDYFDPEEIILNSLHTGWDSVIASEQTEVRRTQAVEYLFESQIVGIANLLALVLEMSTNPWKARMQYALRMMNCFYTYDRPEDSFVRYGFASHQVIRGYEGDRRILRNFLKLTNLASRFPILMSELNSEGPLSLDLEVR